jgi:hypothetical protein
MLISKIGPAGATAPRSQFFIRDWTAGDLKFKLQCRDSIACTGYVVAACVVIAYFASCNSVTWCRRIQGRLGIGCFCPIFMICSTGSCVLTTDFQCIYCPGILKSAQKNSLFLKSSIILAVNVSMFHSIMIHAVVLLSKKIPFVLLLPRFAQQFKFPRKFHPMFFD